MDISKAWINGRTLAGYASAAAIRERFGHINAANRVALDIERDREILGLNRPHGVPFVLGSHTVVCIHDFDLSGPQPQLIAGSMMALANLCFTRHALDSGISGFIEESSVNDTRRLEQLGSTLDLDNGPALVAFSEEVCRWGRGQRVWGNLMRFHTPKHLAELLRVFLGEARCTEDPCDALAPGLAIKGLGMSFASKHLRLLDPSRFVTLDEVVTDGLGYAPNRAGYALLLHDLERLRVEHHLPYRPADLESGLFVLVRQLVRATLPKSTEPAHPDSQPLERL